jgi:hypothetical protein
MEENRLRIGPHNRRRSGVLRERLETNPNDTIPEPMSSSTHIPIGMITHLTGVQQIFHRALHEYPIKQAKDNIPRVKVM